MIIIHEKGGRKEAEKLELKGESHRLKVRARVRGKEGCCVFDI